MVPQGCSFLIQVLGTSTWTNGKEICGVQPGSHAHRVMPKPMKLSCLATWLPGSLERYVPGLMQEPDLANLFVVR